MPNVRGVVLTDRDRALLTYVGLARYASAEQIHRLIAPEHSKKLVYRRLAKLCLPGGLPGEGACLHRLHYRRREGTSVPVWALTPYGRSLVAPQFPWLPAPAAKDVGARFMEHALILNDVLLRLVLMFRRSASAPLTELPFRWLAEGDQVLEFQIFGRQLADTRAAVLKPDAILEVTGRRLRVFVEAETGTQSIVTAHPDRTGAVVAKLRRYRTFLSGRSDDIQKTWYQRAFPDGHSPRLLFIVHSEGRKIRVREAIKAELGSAGDAWVLVHTFAEAADKLLGYLPDPVTEPEQLPRVGGGASPARPATPPATGTHASQPATASAPPATLPALALDQAQLRTIGKVFQEMAYRILDIEKALVRHQREKGCALDVPRIPREQMDILASVVLYGETRRIHPPAAPGTGSR